jgi:gamma-glutamyltranspeptidase/glutathione hydrolase
VRRRVTDGNLPRASEEFSFLDEKISEFAVQRLVPAPLGGSLKREGRVFIGQNTIHRIHHIDELHMQISSLSTLVCRVRAVQHGLSVRRRVALATGVALALLHAVALPKVSSGAHLPSAEGRSAAVATDHADATRAALDVMAAGGNAADGAVAAALALGVVNPSASGLGGGGFALVFLAKDASVTALDFRERAPAAFDAGSRTKEKGPSVGVPGEPAGLELLATRFGRRSLAANAAPAIALAQNGFYLSRHTAEVAAVMKDRIRTVPSLAAFLLPGGTPAPFASRVRRPDLATTLVRYGAEGKKAIYEGSIAKDIVDAVAAAGGAMKLADLADYTVKERAPLKRTIEGRTIYTMPAPSAGGLMLLETLSMYGATKSSSLVSMGFGSSAYLHTVAEAMRGAFADRARLAGDPDLDASVNGAFESALDPAQLDARRKRIDLRHTHAPAEFKTKENGTSHLIVADAAGNVVSLTTTVNGPFGANLVAGETGIVLNNELDDFTSPEDAAVFGMTNGGPNRPRAGSRPVSSMTPTIVVEAGVPILATGGSGGTRIATGTTQAVLARLLFDLDPNVCVSSPRVHTQGTTLLVDSEIAVDVRDALKARGETLKEEPFKGSAIQMITWERSAAGTRLHAAADPRKGGFAMAR